MNSDTFKIHKYIQVATLLGIAFLVGETTCTGFTKTCYYDYLGNTYAMTIPCTSLCPLSLEIPE